MATTQQLLRTEPSTTLKEAPTFLSLIARSFNTHTSIEKTKVFSILVLLRKHVFYHMCRLYPPSPSPSIRSFHHSLPVDLYKFQDKATTLATVIGFNNYNKIEVNILKLIKSLKQLSIVHKTSKCTSNDLNFLVEELGIPPKDIKKYWLEDQDSCSCHIPKRRHDILSSIYTELLVEKIVNEEHCSFTSAKEKASKIPEHELLQGMLRLALEIWSLDCDLVAFKQQRPETTDEIINYYQGYQEKLMASDHPLPNILHVVIDNQTGKIATVLPNGDVPFKKEGEDTERNKENKDDDDNVVGLDHPYIQMKLAVLVKDRGYPASIANKLLIWSLIPSNTVIPFNLILLLIKHANRPVKLGDRAILSFDKDGDEDKKDSPTTCYYNP